MNFQIPDNKLLELRNVLNRAMNTWEPAHWPKWLIEWSVEVDTALGMHVEPAKRFAHRLHERADNLQHCMVCGGAEASLPADCPGVRLSNEQEIAIADERLNFYDGVWIDLVELRKAASPREEGSGYESAQRV